MFEERRISPESKTIKLPDNQADWPVIDTLIKRTLLQIGADFTFGPSR
jgi:hypothetical protein